MTVINAKSRPVIMIAPKDDTDHQQDVERGVRSKGRDSELQHKVTVHLDPGSVLSMDMSNMNGLNNVLVTTSREGDSVNIMAQGFYSLYVYTSLG